MTCDIVTCDIKQKKNSKKSIYNKLYIEVIFDLNVTCHKSQCHKLKIIVKYLIMSKIVKKSKGTVGHFDDDSFEFQPYGKGEPVYDYSHKVGGLSCSGCLSDTS